MEVLMEKPAAGNWEKFCNKRGELGAYKQRIMEKWSIKDYNEVSYPSDKLFFESFESLVQPLWDILGRFIGT
jgi:adenosine deaminase/adenosine deaminase CECR1